MPTLRMSLLAAWVTSAASTGPTPLMERCRTGCEVQLQTCNGTAPVQRWRYTPSDPMTIGLAHSGEVNSTYGLCLNVRAYGTSPGSLVWVTLCHPDAHANYGWAFNASADLVNTRSGLCATATGFAGDTTTLSTDTTTLSTDDGGSVLIRSCKAPADQQWAFDAKTGTIAVQGAWPGPQKCLGVSLAMPPPGPAPGPPHPSPSPPGPATVQIDTATVVHVVDERYVSFNLDGSYNRGWFQRDLANAKLRFLTAQLSPAVLRHGGSGNDYFDYDVPTATSPATTAPACLPGKSYPALPGTSRCPPWSDSKICAASVAKPGFCESAATGPEPNCCTECHHAWNSTSYPWPHGGVQGCSPWSHANGPATLTCTCLTQPKFDAVLEFAAATNTSLVFGLTFSADVNSSHTAALLRHVAGGEHAVYGYEYGNEQVKVERAAEQFGVLQRMLPGLYSAPPESKPVPKLIGPDWFNTDPPGFFPAINREGVELHAFTFHEYLQGTAYGSAGAMQDKLAGPSLASLRKAGAKDDVELWVGEAGGLSGGGVRGFTDGYTGGRWWLASLGVHALFGVSVFCRQDLVGGNYGLLADNFPWNTPLSTDAVSMQAVEPMPDFWTAVLWKQLMGQRVLKASVAQPGTPNLMAFMHCSKRHRDGGGVAMVLINTDDGSGVNVTFLDAATRRGPRVEYVLAGVGLHGISLNGDTLAVSGDASAGWSMPSLEGKPTPAGAEGAVELAPNSYMFLEYPEAGVAVCSHP